MRKMNKEETKKLESSEIQQNVPAKKEIKNLTDKNILKIDERIVQNHGRITTITGTNIKLTQKILTKIVDDSCVDYATVEILNASTTEKNYAVTLFLDNYRF